MTKRYKIQRIHKGRSYSTEEIAILLGVHNQTVRNWKKEGLQPIDNTKSPYLFYGEDIQTFLKKLNVKSKVKLEANEIYCLKCRKGVVPTIPMNIERGVTLGGNKLSYFRAGFCPFCNKDLRGFATRPITKATDKAQFNTIKRNSNPEAMYTMGLFESGGDG